jgi:biopolymer transport protein ExbB
VGGSPEAVADATASGEAGPSAGEPIGSPVTPSRSLRDWYAMGGPVMRFLSLCSILVVGLVLERCFCLRRSAVAPRRLEKAVREAVESGNRAFLFEAVEGDRSALARLVGPGLVAADPIECVASRGAAEAKRLRRNLPLLAALGNLATMLGLLGTVLGMIEAFQLIAAAGVGDARIVAGGIFRALITTAAGLVVGIGAVTAHAFLARTAEDGIARLEELTSALFEGKALARAVAPVVVEARQRAV